ncbi:MAG: hypothetical protein AB7U95_00495 [Reyranella sp.]
MRLLICVLAVVAFLACEASSAMHAHLIADPGGMTADDPQSDGGSDPAPYGRIQPCHTCAHALPVLGGLPTNVGWHGSADHPLADIAHMAVGGDWPPLAEPPR